MTTVSLIKEAIPQEGTHSTMRLGLWAMLIACATNQQAEDAIQSAEAERTSNITTTITTPLSQADQTTLNDYETAMEAQSTYWQIHGDKDSQGNDLYGQDMLAYANGYNTLKTDCRNKMDRLTAITDSMSNAVQAINKEETSGSSLMQSALTTYETGSDLINELMG